MDMLWDIFARTGSVEDYLNYREHKVQEQYADNDERLDNTGTDYRGE